MDRILTTHTGSLIRPSSVLGLLDAAERGDDVDENRRTHVMAEAVAEIVRKQADAGVDIVSDGEIGKVSWISYLYERITGLEVRELAPGWSVMPPSRDRQAFPEFYADEDRQYAQQARRVSMLGEKWMRQRRGITPVGPELWACTGPIEYDGLVLLQRDVDNLKVRRTAGAADEGTPALRGAHLRRATALRRRAPAARRRDRPRGLRVFQAAVSAGDNGVRAVRVED